MIFMTDEELFLMYMVSLFQDKCKDDLMIKTNLLADAMTKMKDNELQKQEMHRFKDTKQELDNLRAENQRLEGELMQLRRHLDLKSCNKSNANSVPNGGDKINGAKVIDVEDKLKSNVSSSDTQRLPIPSDDNPVDNSKAINQLEPISPIISDPIKANSLVQNNGLAEEDRKEEALVEANVVNGDNNDNEVADDLKQENKEAEESKAKPIQI